MTFGVPGPAAPTPAARLPLSTPSWRAYLVAVFLNAFNDNAFKVLVGLALLRHVPGESGAAGGGVLLAAVSALFILPFLLFSSWAGSLADRFSKRDVFVVMSGYEIFAMALAAAGFHAFSGPEGASPLGLALVAAALFWTGAQSAFYSPAKYGLIPELLPEEEISRANGQVEAATFAAIVLGTAFGGTVLAATGGRPAMASAACSVVAILGLAAARHVAATPAADPRAPVAWFNPLGETVHVLRDALRDRRLASSMVGLAYFWFLGALVQMAALLLARHALFAGLDDAAIESRTGLLLAVLSLGIGIGSIAAGRLSRGRIEPGLVLHGAAGTTVGLVLVAAASSPSMAALAFGILGFFAGFFAVPLQSAVQGYAPAARRGAFLAASNFVVFSAILLSSPTLPLLHRAVGDAHALFGALALVTVAAAGLLAAWNREFLVRATIVLVPGRIERREADMPSDVPEKHTTGPLDGVP